jgi:pyrroline-5-carboxylate reductase
MSIAAGIRSTDLDRWLGGNRAIVRSMPNTPSLVGTGAAGLFANDKVSQELRDAAESIMRAVGVAIWVENEDDIDAVTAISGSGPAYYFQMMEIMENIAREMGLSPANAHLLTLQTALGAARMAIESSDSAEILKQKVTSPGGTTEAALNSLEQGKIRELYATAVEAARQRSKELANMLGQQ